MGGQGWSGDDDDDGNGNMTMAMPMAMPMSTMATTRPKELSRILQAGQIVIIDPTDVPIERKESFVGR